MIKKSLMRALLSRSLPVYRPAISKAIAADATSSLSTSETNGTSQGSATSAVAATASSPIHGRPLVVILGWAGALQRNLARLNQFYNEEIGVATATLIIPFPVAPSSKKFLEEELCGLITKHYQNNDTETGPATTACTSTITANSIAHKSTETAPMYVHIHSNNGTWAYAGLLQRKDFPTPRALLWDSAPHLFYEHLSVSKDADIISMVGTSSLLKRPQYHHPVISPIVKCIAMAFLSIQRIAKHVLEPIGIRLMPDYISYNHFLRDASPSVPMHFIYSSGDQLCRSEKIEEFIGYLRQRGVPISTTVFGDDVPHITAFFKKTEQYKQVIKDHLLNK